MKIESRTQNIGDTKKLIMITYKYQISLIILTFLAKNLVITISLFIFARKNSDYGYSI